MIEYGLRTRLLAVSAVTDLVGGSSSANSRITVMHLPQNPTFPAVTLQVVSDRPEYDMDGETTLSEVRVQIDCWAVKRAGRAYDAYDVAQQLADAVQTALSGYTGVAGDYTIQSSFLESRRPLYEDDTQTHRVSLDFSIGYAATV